MVERETCAGFQPSVSRSWWCPSWVPARRPRRHGCAPPARHRRAPRWDAWACSGATRRARRSSRAAAWARGREAPDRAWAVAGQAWVAAARRREAARRRGEAPAAGQRAVEPCRVARGPAAAAAAAASACCRRTTRTTRRAESTVPPVRTAPPRTRSATPSASPAIQAQEVAAPVGAREAAARSVMGACSRTGCASLAAPIVRTTVSAAASARRAWRARVVRCVTLARASRPDARWAMRA